MSRTLNHTVTLKNYIGEVNDAGAWQTSIIRRCRIRTDSGISRGLPSRENDRAVLYVFDRESVVTDEAGQKRAYLPPNLFMDAQDKSPYFTFSTLGRDKLVDADGNEYAVTDAAHLVDGSRRMHHWEVTAR